MSSNQILSGGNGDLNEPPPKINFFGQADNFYQSLQKEKVKID